MVGSMLLYKMLHCKRREKSKQERYNSGESTAQETLSEVNIETEPKGTQSKNRCRVCLKEGRKPIFDTQSSVDLSKLLNVIASIEVRTDDPFPKFLCQSCYALLQGAMLFRKTALESDKLLKKLHEKKQKLSALPAHPQIPQKFKKWKEMGAVSVKPDCITDAVKHSFVNDTEDFANDTDNVEPIAESNIICKKCDQKFMTHDEYNDHRLSLECQHKRIKCNICNKDCDALYLKKHMRIHEDTHICDICGKKVALATQFARHRLTHFYHLPIQCPLCPYRGRFKESLKMHMRTHTGEKPYQCEQCPGRFINKSNLNKHMLTHKGKEFRCEVCGKGFYTKREIELHIKVDHTGIKDQACRFCGKTFGYRKQVMKHELKVHNREKMRSGRMPIYLKVESMKQQNGAAEEITELS